MQHPIIYYNKNKYSFSLKAILLFLVGGLTLSILIYLFLELGINDWLKEIVAKQTSFFLNLIGDVNAQAIYTPVEDISWKIYIPSINMSFYLSTWCTGAHIFSLFIGTIILVPQSKNSITGKGFLWRKMKALVVLISFIYIGNIIRLIFILGSAYVSLINWSFIHSILNFMSGIIAAIVYIYTLYKILPEFFISIYFLYSLRQIKKKIKI